MTAARLGERRSVVTSSAEYVVFGQPGDLGGRTDRYWRTEAGYTYRPLRRIAEFGIRAGVVRGPNPDPTKPDLGLNYGAPSSRLRLGDIWHLEGEFLTSVTEVGFSVGVGSALVVGDPYGSKLSLGFESIQVFGTRLYSRMDIAARRNLVIAPSSRSPTCRTPITSASACSPKRVRRRPGFTLGVLEATRPASRRAGPDRRRERCVRVLTVETAAYCAAGYTETLRFLFVFHS